MSMAALRPEERRRRWSEAALVVGLLALALVLRLYDLTGESLWYDEAYSVWISDMDVGSLKVLWAWRVEFPLYYLLFHYWLRWLGQGEFAVRLFGALAGVVTVIPMYLLGKGLFGRRAGALGALLLAVNPYHVWYSQEVRMHSWAVLLSVTSLYLFWRLVHGGKWGWWAAHVVVTGLTFHLHYYIGWVVLAQNAYYLLHLWRERRAGRGLWPGFWPWLLDDLAVLALAIPAVVVFWVRFVAANDWGWLVESYRAPGLRDVVGLLIAYVAGTAFPGPGALRWGVVFLYAALAAWGVWYGFRRKGAGGAWHGATWLALLATALPLGIIWGLGQFAALWVPRYLLLFLPPFLLLAALGLGALSPRWLAYAGAVLLLGGSLYALSGMYGRPQKEDWRGVAAYISAHATQDDLVVLMDEECRVPFSYYYGSKGVRVEVSRFADEAALARAIGEVERKARGENLWLVVSHADGAALESRLDAVPRLREVDSPPFVGIRLVCYAWS